MKINSLVSLSAHFEKAMVEWDARNGMNFLRVTLGVVFFWFGFLKFFGSIGASEILAARTISTLTFGFVRSGMSLPVLGMWECTIGLGLISKKWLSITIVLLFFQMIGTFLPLVFYVHECFSHPFVPTLLGQYIIKNLVLVSAGIVIGATARGGRLMAYPKTAAVKEI